MEYFCLLSNSPPPSIFSTPLLLLLSLLFLIQARHPIHFRDNRTHQHPMIVYSPTCSNQLSVPFFNILPFLARWALKTSWALPHTLFSTLNVSGDTICYTLYTVLNLFQLLYRNSHMAIFLIGLCVSTPPVTINFVFLHIDFQSFWFHPRFPFLKRSPHFQLRFFWLHQR